jgi:hypothetical protein
MVEAAATDGGVDIATLCLADVERGEWRRDGYERRWTFTGRVGGEDRSRSRMSTAAYATLERVVAWRERPLLPADGAARVQAIRAAIEAAAPGSTHDLPEEEAAFTYRPPGRRLVFTVSAKLTEEAMKRRDEDQRWGMPTAIVPVDETPEEVAARLLGKSD